MKNKFVQIFKSLLILLLGLVISFIVILFVMSILFDSMTIDEYREKYELRIPLGSFDAKYGGGERLVNNEEISIEALYYTKNVDYLIEKYNFIPLNYDDDLLKDLTNKISYNLSVENKDKVEKYLNEEFYVNYYLFVENKNGKLLLLYDNNSKIIYCIENNKN